MRYGAVGCIITNRIDFTDGSQIDGIMGGTVYGLEGIRFYDESCQLFGNVGDDFERDYGPWMDRNRIPRAGIATVGEYTIYDIVRYAADGTYEEIPGHGESYDEFRFNFGVMTPDHRNVAPYADGLKGLYVALGTDPVFWRELYALKQRYGFQIMYEVINMDTFPDRLDRVMNVLQYVDMLSINLPETKRLFGLETEQQCIDKLKSLNLPFVLFRVGDRGLYAISGGKHFFVPCLRYEGKVQDPTGCGNSSTSASMVGFCEGHDPLMCGVMGSVAAHFNVRQYGPVQDFSSELMAEVRQMVHTQYDQLAKQYIAQGQPPR